MEVTNNLSITMRAVQDGLGRTVPDSDLRMLKNYKSENQSKFNSKMNSKHDFKRIDSDSSLLMDTDDKEVLKILQTAKKVLEKSLRQETRATRLLFGKFSKRIHMPLRNVLLCDVILIGNRR